MGCWCGVRLSVSAWPARGGGRVGWARVQKLVATVTCVGGVLKAPPAPRPVRVPVA